MRKHVLALAYGCLIALSGIERKKMHQIRMEEGRRTRSDALEALRLGSETRSLQASTVAYFSFVAVTSTCSRCLVAGSSTLPTIVAFPGVSMASALILVDRNIGGY